MVVFRHIAIPFWMALAMSLPSRNRMDLHTASAIAAYVDVGLF